jgi:hypothetical protein
MNLLSWNKQCIKFVTERHIPKQLTDLLGNWKMQICKAANSRPMITEGISSPLSTPHSYDQFNHETFTFYALFSFLFEECFP